ncbi:MAG: response regulator [Oscillatoriaceae cyanobacterium Prado104]|jgi:CheY-like chemotaxis protein|nr:response regulator [Oscillatoriaceae cyanobacterium Prado104]
MKKILVIEDDNSIRETLLEILEARGFEAVGARNGQLGIQLAVAQVPDVILSDVMMPELNGFEVFAAVRSHPTTARIPFIFMTGSEMEQALELKADGYLPKPCSVKEMVGAIALLLEKSAATNGKSAKIQANSAKQPQNLRELHQTARFELPSLC